MKDDTGIKRGGKNLFADIGYADPETHLLKAGMVTRIRYIISESKLAQTEAAERMGLSQPDVSRLLRGQFRDVSVERLMRMLTKLGCDVDLVFERDAQGARRRGIEALPDPPLPAIDSLLAATASQHGLILVTRNLRDVQGLGVQILSPWDE